MKIIIEYILVFLGSNHKKIPFKW